MRTWLNKIGQLMVSLFHWYGIYIKSSTEAYFKLQLTFLVRVFINKMIKKNWGTWLEYLPYASTWGAMIQIKSNFCPARPSMVSEHRLRATHPSWEFSNYVLRASPPRRQIDVPRKLVVSTLAPHTFLGLGFWLIRGIGFRGILGFLGF